MGLVFLQHGYGLARCDNLPNPYQFRGLVTIGTIVFIVDLVFFLLFCALIIARFLIVPKAFISSLRHPVEAFYIGTFWVSISLILQNISQYGSAVCGPWLQKALQVCFWLYTGSVILVAVFQYYVLFISQRLEISKMVPAWILPIYPLLVTGPLAGVLLANQPASSAVPIFVSGVLSQGLGWMVATFLYVIWTLRLFSADLPPRPAALACTLLLVRRGIPRKLYSRSAAVAPKFCLRIS